ncbi:ubiquitin elongating factor core-domain-containing protein, partial [Blyttiomyces helicus]
SPTPSQSTYLESLVSELESESLPLKMTHSILERVIYARLSLPSNAEQTAQPLLDYLVECWNRIGETRRRVKDVAERGGDEARKVAARRLEMLETARGLVISYSGLVVNFEMGECFPQHASIAEQGPGYIAQKLLLPSVDDVERALPKQFLDEFVQRFEGDGLDEIMKHVMLSLGAFMRSQNVTKGFKTPLRALLLLTSFKPIAALLPTFPNWNPPNQSPKSLELLSLLGPFYAQTSTLPSELADTTIATTYFGSRAPDGDAVDINEDLDGNSIGARGVGDVRSAMDALRGLAEGVHEDLFNVVMAIIKSGPEGRDSVVQFFGSVAKLNVRRAMMQVDRRLVSSDGFMYNVLKTCLKLCDPIMDSNFSKIHLIDPDYPFHPACVLDLATDTRLNADKESLEAHIAERKLAAAGSAAPNFVTHVFFETLALHHYGLLSTIRQHKDHNKRISELKKEVMKMRADRDAGNWTGPAAAMMEKTLKDYQMHLEKWIGYRLALETTLLDNNVLEHSLRFYSLVMMWLIRCTVTGSAQVRYPNGPGADQVAWSRIARGETMGLPLFPLPEVPAKTFVMLPEWIVEDVCDFYLFICHQKPLLFEHLPRDEFMAFSMIILKSGSYIKNPYLKSKLVEILYFFTFPLYRNGSGRLDIVFYTHPMAKENLVRAVMKFYVDVEQTGMQRQFYDKFNIRYHISQILKSVWNDPGHVRKVIEESRKKEDFVKFVALLMQDTTYLLDEALSKFKEIQTIQNELAQPRPPNMSREDTDRLAEREKSLRDAEGQASSYMSLGNETVHMLQYLTANPEIVDPFMAPEVVERLAAMLDYNLVALVGPRCTELKVKNPEKYRFDPKRLLNELMEIFMHLAHRDEFVAAVARDGRSYARDHFARAKSILLKNMLKSQVGLDVIDEFIVKVETTIKTGQVEEEELGDVPDEF